MKTKSILKSLSALLSLAASGLVATSGKAEAAQAPELNSLEARIKAVHEKLSQQAAESALVQAPDAVLGQASSDAVQAGELRWLNWRNGIGRVGRWNNWRNGGWNNWRNGWGNGPWGNWFNR